MTPLQALKIYAFPSVDCATLKRMIEAAEAAKVARRRICENMLQRMAQTKLNKKLAEKLAASKPKGK